MKCAILNVTHFHRIFIATSMNLYFNLLTCSSHFEFCYFFFIITTIMWSKMLYLKFTCPFFTLDLSCGERYKWIWIFCCSFFFLYYNFQIFHNEMWRQVTKKMSPQNKIPTPSIEIAIASVYMLYYYRVSGSFLFL